MKPVIVTGMGILCSLGQGIENFSQALFKGKNNFTQSFRYPMLTFPIIAAELENFIFNEALKQYADLPSELFARAVKGGQRAPLSIQTSIITALEAWKQSRLSERKIASHRIGLIVAGQNISQGYQYKLHSTFEQNPSYLSPTYALHFMDTDQIGTLSEIFNIKGEGFTIGGASASGNLGIIQGCRLIKQNIVDVCLVVGALADLSPLEIQGFHNIGALGGQRFYEQPNKTCRPFDRQRDGFIWGQSCGSMILESAHEAVCEVSSLGEISGTSIVLDAHRTSTPNQEGERRSMQQALQSAGKSVKDLQYINTHGSSSGLGDQIELAAICDLLGKDVQRVWLNSTKSIIGHSLWAAGVVEAIATLLQMNMDFLHPNLNLEDPIDQNCRFIPGTFQEVKIDTALSNSFGFGGINSSILFTRTES